MVWNNVSEDTLNVNQVSLDRAMTGHISLDF